MKATVPCICRVTGRSTLGHSALGTGRGAFGATFTHFVPTSAAAPPATLFRDPFGDSPTGQHAGFPSPLSAGRELPARHSQAPASAPHHAKHTLPAEEPDSPLLTSSMSYADIDVEAAEKDLRKLRKRLRQIILLEGKERSGEELDAGQQAKLRTKAEVTLRIQELDEVVQMHNLAGLAGIPDL